MDDFPKGMRVFKKHPNAPDFVVADMTISLPDFIEDANKNQKGGEVKLTIKEAKSGKYYCIYNRYEPKEQ